MAPKPTEVGIQRTASDAAALVVERTVDGSGRQALEAPGARRRTIAGVAMLVVGFAVTVAALVMLGTRVGTTAEAVRGTELDPVGVYLLGTEGSGAELAFVVVLLVLVPIGIVLGWLGYRRVSDRGLASPSVHQSSLPSAVIARHSSPNV